MTAANDDAIDDATGLYLMAGLDQPGGKLPLFDRDGQAVEPAVIRACMERGLCEPWFSNPLKPDWIVCRLTDAGRAAAEAYFLRRQR